MYKPELLPDWTDRDTDTQTQGQQAFTWDFVLRF